METQDVQIRATEFQGKPLHIIKPMDGADHLFVRAAEWAIWGSDTGHTSTLNHALKRFSQPPPVLLRRNSLPVSINQTDLAVLMSHYREFQLALDPACGRPPKMLSIVLVSSIETIAVERGNRELLIALDCEVPEQLLLEHQQEELEKDPEGPLVDLLIEERLDELREISIQAELCEYEPFQEDAEDEAKLANYALQPCRSLELQLYAYHDWKTRAYAWDRDATAVVAVTAKSDVSSMLRFLGFLDLDGTTVKGLKQLTAVHPSKLQVYCEFLIARPVTHGTVSNYLNGLVNVLAYVQSLCIANDDSSDFEDCPNTVDALIDAALKLRSQAEKQAKVQNLYKSRHPAWCSWPEAKQTRLNALAVMEAKLQQRPFNRQEALMAVEDALLISLNTVMPPDRCGVIRRLCLHDTLKQQSDGSYHIDVTQFKQHKTARFYGPAMTPISPVIKPTLDKWLELTQSGFEFNEYGAEEDANRTRRRYIFSQRRDTTRCLESSAYTARFKSAFERHSPNKTPTPPSLLRSAFITHMREHTTDQEVLQSAATAMKHSLKMQSSDTYDLDIHIRATQAAMNFCHEFATSTEAIVQPPATPPMEQPQPSNADFDAIDDVMSPIQPTWDRQLPPTAAVGNINTVTQANTTSPHPQQGTAVPTDESILEPQYEINIVTAGEIVQGGARHRILWEESPELLQWWGELPENFVFQSAKYVPREILIQTGRSKKDVELGLIGSIQPPLRSSAEVQLANGSMVQLDLLTCVFKRLNADQPKIVTWQLTCPETWLLEDDKWPVIINDSFVGWDYSSESLSARNEWLKTNGKLFPNEAEAAAVLEAARATVDDKIGSCQLTAAVLEWYQSKEPTLLPTAINNLDKLLGCYQKGSLLNDSVQVLVSLTRDWN